MALNLLADAAASDNAGIVSVLILLVVAVVKAYLSHMDAKEAAAKATTEAEKAAAAKIAANASADMAAAKQAGLDALVLYIESQKRKMTEAESKKTSGQIRVFTGLKDSEAVVSEAVTRLTKNGDDTPKRGTTFVVTPPENGTGNPFPTRPAAAIMLALLIPMSLAGGCVNAAVHDGAVASKKAAAHIRDTSEPSVGWLDNFAGKDNGRGGKWTREELKAVWVGEFNALDNAIDATERASR